ncbi:MAG: hypothetical protein V3R13_04755 [Nitrososphaerales archaeon]
MDHLQMALPDIFFIVSQFPFVVKIARQVAKHAEQQLICTQLRLREKRIASWY